ncbi:protease complex subunit PrcB family protein [Flavobacterium sp. 25HG05S-40]|uniref:protease complex subunit PrcB family protein n=1 Tax=Flavobacterium sp. 25HG05S-40 TaxID=3458682 RepID=UPI0040443255
MRKYLSIFVILALYSCSSTKNAVDKPLFEVLVVNHDGGANIKFYEILSEPKEIQMLLGDETLGKLIKSKDIAESSFLVLNTGPTKESYNRMKVEKVVETATQIEVYLKDTQKNVEPTMIDDNTKYPYTVVKVNSKKTIVIK